jgi:hypothetical protein
MTAPLSATHGNDLAAAARKCFDSDPDKAGPQAFSTDAAWMVLDAANDLGDHATIEACRRVIDASLNGRLAPQSDLYLVLDYFR